MLNYEVGRSHLKFNTDTYDFYQMLLEHLSSISEARGGSKIESLKELHLAPGIQDNVEEYRQYCFSLFRTEEFQQLFKSFGKYLIDEHFDGDGLIQKTPTVRIQLPGAESTSYHSDGWYGHGSSVRSFWLPLTRVESGNTLYMADDVNQSLQCMEDIRKAKANLHDINRIARSICSPFEGDFGDLLTFSSEMIHGANKNTRETTRVSFDFRIAPDPKDIGTKPLSNFFSRAELTSDGTVRTDVKNSRKINYSGITYSNLCGGASAKSQLMLCALFCETNNIGIIGNESEIVTFDHLPVLRHYLASDMENINSIVVFSAAIFDGNVELAQAITGSALQNEKTIIFCAESIFMSTEEDARAIIQLVSAKSG